MTGQCVQYTYLYMIYISGKLNLDIGKLMIRPIMILSETSSTHDVKKG